MIAITLLAYTHNCATNLLPLILGLFFKIGGTSSHVMTMLSNVGLCISGQTVECLKKQISDDAFGHAAELMKSGCLFCTISTSTFGNSNNADELAHALTLYTSFFTFFSLPY